MVLIKYKPGMGKVWTLENVKFGFEKFFETFGRYPTSFEIDDFDYLPSSRQIQRTFGGLINLRNKLGLSIENYSAGDSRSKIAVDINSRGQKLEIIVRDYLQAKFKEPFVHIERPLHTSSKDRFDFYVYAKPKNFAIDVFGTADFRCLTRVMNIKEKKYRKDNILREGEVMYFIYFCDCEITNKVLDWQRNRKGQFPASWKIITFDDFKKDIINFDNYELS